MKTNQSSKIFTIIEIGKQFALCEDAKGDTMELARYKLPLEASVGSKLYQDSFSMYKLVKEKNT